MNHMSSEIEISFKNALPPEMVLSPSPNARTFSSTMRASPADDELAHDNGFIEPQHLMLALLAQEDGGTASLLQRAGVNVPPLKKALEDSVARLPKVEGTGGEITISRDLNNLLNLTDKEATKRGDQFIASEMFLVALAVQYFVNGFVDLGLIAKP